MANPLKALVGEYGSDSEDESEHNQHSPPKKRMVETGPSVIEAFLRVRIRSLFVYINASYTICPLNSFALLGNARKQRKSLIIVIYSPVTAALCYRKCKNLVLWTWARTGLLSNLRTAKTVRVAVNIQAVPVYVLTCAKIFKVYRPLFFFFF